MTHLNTNKPVFDECRVVCPVNIVMLRNEWIQIVTIENRFCQQNTKKDTHPLQLKTVDSNITLPQLKADCSWNDWSKWNATTYWEFLFLWKFHNMYSDLRDLWSNFGQISVPDVWRLFFLLLKTLKESNKKIEMCFVFAFIRVTISSLV